jgi:CBS domain containing-hemolysin-like protein
VTLDDLKTKFELPLEETADYKTLAGLVLARLKRIPKGGEVIQHEGLRMTVVATDRRRVRKVRIEKAS